MNGIPGIHQLTKNRSVLLSSSIGNGTSSLLVLCTELKCFGVMNFIFIVVGGIIYNIHKEGNLGVVNHAYSGVGVT